jgi:hypothetical protein
MKTPRLITTALTALLLSLGSAFGETLEEKAKQTIIPKFELKEATVEDALKEFTKATGIKTFYLPLPNNNARLTVSLSKIPASEAMKYITGLANLVFVYGKDGVHVTVALPEN